MAVESRRKSKRLFDAIRKRLSAHAKRRGANKKTPFFPETAEPPKNPLREAWRAEALQIQSEPGDMRGGFGSLAQQGFRVSTNGTHFCGDAGRGGKPLPMPSAAAACTPPGAAASRFRYHVPAVRFAHRNMMFPSLQGCSQPCSERPSTCRRSEALRSKVSLRVSPAAPPGAGETCPGGKGRQRRPFSTSWPFFPETAWKTKGRACRARPRAPLWTRLRADAPGISGEFLSQPVPLRSRLSESRPFGRSAPASAAP